MRTRTRYLLIVLGFIVFTILAPTLVFLVRGLKVDVDNRKALETGILSVLTKPEDAEIFLNGIKNSESPESIRFLNPSDYFVEIKKEGYRNWSKRLTIQASKVTGINLGVEALYLFKNDESTSEIDTGVKNYFVKSGDILYVTDSQLIRAKSKDLANKTFLSLPKAEYQITHSSNSNYFIFSSVTKKFLYSFGNNTLKDITSVVGLNSDVRALDNGNLAWINNNALFIKRGENKPVQYSKNATALTSLSEGVYFSDTLNKNSQIWFLDAGRENATPELILSTTTQFSKPELMVNPGKAVFVLDNENLYRVGVELKRVIGQVKTVNLDEVSGYLSIASAGELNYYNPEGEQLVLVSRSLASYSSPLVRPSIGYSFAITDNEVKAIELDGRDRPNVYSFGSAKENGKILISEDLKYLYILTEGKLTSQIIH